MTGSPLGFGATTASQDSTLLSGWMAWPGPGNHSISLNQSLNWDAPGSNLPGHRHPPRVAEEKNWPALLILVVIILTVGGNILVILAVSLEKKLQNATNFFLSSLAVADMLVGILVMPISLINILYDYVWPLPNALCPIWIYLDVLFSTSSIMHLCAISLDRYLGIRNPIKHSRFNSRTKAMLKIGAVWTISIVISMPIPVIGLHNEDKVFVNGSCVLNEGRFVLVGSFMAFFIPLVIMVTTYCLTVQVLQRQATDFLDKSGAPSSRHRCSPTPEGKPSHNFLTPKDISVIPSCPETTPQYSSRGGWRDSGGYGKRGMMQAIKNERRASKVLGVVFFLFLVMWCPFFITNVMNVLCRGACNGLLLEELLNIFVWVGYISSGVNPLVYTLFNKTYRHAFSQYMRCRYRPERCKAPLNHRSCVPSPAVTFTLLCGKEALDRNSNCRNGSSNPLSSQDLDDTDERQEMQPGTSEVSVNSCCAPAERTSCM